MITFADAVVASNTTTDIAYVVCIVSFFIAGGVAIYLLWDNIHKTGKKRAAARSRVSRPSTSRKAPAKKSAAKKVAKKPVKKTTKRK